MSRGDQNKPGGKSGRRNRKAGPSRTRKADQQPIQQPEPEAKPLIEVAVAPTAPSSIAAAVPGQTPAIGLRTIASAYGDCTLKSLGEAQSLVEKLSGVRSLDKVVEIQAEFAKQAFDTFVADSQKICELYSELARQAFKPWKPPAAR